MSDVVKKGVLDVKKRNLFVSVSLCVYLWMCDLGFELIR